MKWLHILGVNVMTMSPAKKMDVRNGRLRANHFSLTKENQVGVCYLRACDPFRFSGKYVKDDAANWFWNLYETGISGG